MSLILLLCFMITASTICTVVCGDQGPWQSLVVRYQISRHRLWMPSSWLLSPLSSWLRRRPRVGGGHGDGHRGPRGGGRGHWRRGDPGLRLGLEGSRRWCWCWWCGRLRLGQGRGQLISGEHPRHLQQGRAFTSSNLSCHVLVWLCFALNIYKCLQIKK